MSVRIEVEKVDLRDRKKRIRWSKIESEIFKDDSNLIPSIASYREKKGIESTFFVLKRGDEAIGRAIATFDHTWVERQEENVGFLDDLVIDPDFLPNANMLIEACISFLKEKDIDSVLARSCKFPALRTDGFEKTPTYSLPGNPESTLMALEDFGFTPVKRWMNIFLDFSRQIPDQNLSEAQEFLKSIDVRFVRLNFKKEMMAYYKFMNDVFLPLFGYTPMNIYEIGERKWITSILFRLFRINYWVLKDKKGDIIGAYDFYPDLNLALKKLFPTKGPKVIKPLKIPSFLFEVRRTKVAVLGSMGLKTQIRDKGAMRNFSEYRISLIKRAGFSQLITTPMLYENTAIMKYISFITKRYDLISEQNFATLSYHLG